MPQTSLSVAKHSLRLVPLFLAVALGAAAAAPSVAAAESARRIGVGIYGSNGHQLSIGGLSREPHARPVAVAGVAKPRSARDDIKEYASLKEMLADPAVELVSLCSPRRADQARDAILCLQAGKHVYAEKPSALTERELDEILAVAQKTGREFHEQAMTVFVQPYFEMRRLVKAGAIGEVIQVLIQKSYPYGAKRPQDEAIDGGLFLQAGIHAMRMVEHGAGVRVRTIQGWETGLGDPEEGNCKIAASIQMGLENGGLATVIMNYLNLSNFKPRNNETLRIFGTKGFIESVDDGTRTRLVSGDRIVEPLDTSVKPVEYFPLLAAHLATGAPMPLTSEEELHPLRVLLRAKTQVRAEPVARSSAKLEHLRSPPP